MPTPGLISGLAVFVSLGKLLGPKWDQYHNSIKKYLLIATIIIAALFILSFLYKKYRLHIFELAMKTLKNGEEMFHSSRHVKILVVITFVAFLSLFALLIGLIQDFLANEFAQFDMVTSFIVHAMFDESWSFWMNAFAFLASFMVLVPIIALTFLWIIIKGKDRMLEAVFLLIVVIGGEMWDEDLRRLFHRVGPVPSSGHIPYTFPSEQTFITLIVLGLTAFLLARHFRSIWIRYPAPLMVVIASLLVGLSRIYFEVQFPSDVVAGYIFGGVWLSLNIMLLEIFRLFRKDKMNFLRPS